MLDAGLDVADSDMAFLMDVDQESESDDSCSTLSSASLDIDEITDLISNIHEYAQDYIDDNILGMSSCKFYEDMYSEILERVGVDLECSGFLGECTAELYEFVDEIVKYHFEILQIPPREIRYEAFTESAAAFTESAPHTFDAALPDKIRALQEIPQPKQKTQEWYEFRYNLITASNLWKVFGTEASVNSLIYEKCKPLTVQTSSYASFSLESPMHWGVKYEPLTVMVYEDMYKTKIGDFGCIQHPKYSCIGASPDGINIDSTNTRLYGRMLEIKNIANREITGIPKEEYWIQTQIQMETCDLDECDFMETRFLEYIGGAEEFYADTKHAYKGVILHFIQNQLTMDNGAPFYVYMPLNIELTPEDIGAWILEQRKLQKNVNRVLCSTLYWYLEEFSCVLIKRNRAWFRTAASRIEYVWNIILNERVSGYEHRAAKKRVPKVGNMADLSNSSIGVAKPTNSICLVRLDY